MGFKFDELGGHELLVARGLEQVFGTGAELVAAEVVHHEPGSDPVAERQQLLAAVAFGEAAVAGENDGEDAAGVEAGADQDAQLAEHLGGHLLGPVDQQHGTHEGRVDVGQ